MESRFLLVNKSDKKGWENRLELGWGFWKGEAKDSAREKRLGFVMGF